MIEKRADGKRPIKRTPKMESYAKTESKVPGKGKAKRKTL